MNIKILSVFVFPESYSYVLGFSQNKFRSVGPIYLEDISASIIRSLLYFTIR